MTGLRRPVRRVAAMAFLVMGLLFSIIGPALPGIRAEFGLALGEAGLLPLASSLGYLLCVLAGGPLADRRGRRPVLLAGVAALTVGVTAFALAPAWAALLLAVGVIGAGLGLLEVPINALVSEHGGARREADLNLTHACFGLGAIVGPLLAGALLGVGVGWRWVIVPGALALVALGGLAGRLRLGATDAPPLGAAPTWAVARAPVVWLLALVLGLYVGVELMVGTWAYSHLRATFGASDGSAGLATALYWGGLTLGRALLGTVGARLNGHGVVVGNIVGGVLTLGLLTLAPTLPLAMLALALFGLAIANVFPTILGIVGASYPRSMAAVTTILIGAGGLGGAIFPWLTGVLAERAGLGAALGGGLALLVLMLVAALLAIWRQRAERRSASAARSRPAGDPSAAPASAAARPRPASE